MFFDSIENLLNMGVHGKYVWTSYIIAIGVLSWNFISPILLKKKIHKKLAVISREDSTTN